MSEYNLFVRGADISGVKTLTVSSNITQKELLEKLKNLIGASSLDGFTIHVKGRTLSIKDDNKIISTLTAKDPINGINIPLFSNGTMIILVTLYLY